MNQHNGVSGTLTSGTAVIVNMVSFSVPTSISVTPAAGDTITVTYSMDGGLSYHAWPNGPATAFSSDVLVAPVTHVQFQRTAGAGTTSIYGVI